MSKLNSKDQKHKELDKYLKHWFGMFTKKEKKDWVDNNTDLLEILEAKENEDKYKELG
tara:strand:- start:487 stop:660 length:174 start_codon:yes stop_codon:yes gene_type:complete